MRTIITSVILSMMISSVAGQDIKNVLFVGNSLTSTNDMPEMLHDLASSLGDSVYYYTVVFNGYTLEQHSTNSQTLSHIAAEGWDFVVFQEQSQLPALSTEIFESDVVPHAENLCQYARTANPCVVPVFFMTWGHETGDAENCDEFPWVCTYEGQQDSLYSRYRQLSEMNDAWCAPVGDVWRTTLDVTDNVADLYVEDGIHPTKLGSYLAACTFYALIFGETPEGGEIPGTIDPDEGSLVQSIAGNTVMFNEEEWNIGPIVWADLLFNTDGNFTTITMDTSAAVDSVWVDNGTDTTTWSDGDTGAQTFGESGTYYYVLHIFSECGDEMVIDSVEIVTGVKELPITTPLAFPNPADRIVTIKNIPDQIEKVLVTNSMGEICLTPVIQPGENSMSLDLRKLKPGSYYVVLVTPDDRHVIPITKL